MMTMEYEYHKYAIITGSLSAFCLACDSFLEDEEAASSHLSNFAHSVNLDLAPYVDKFKDHCIRKFTTGYYCQFCNILLPTALKVNIHISEDTHQQNRGTCLLKFIDDNIIAFNNIVISERAWHGLIEDICLICDTEFDDEKQHKQNTAHILNIIQKTVRFGANNAIYREIDHSTIHCLTCNLIFSSHILSKHFEDASHLHRYEIGKLENWVSNNNKQEDKDINESISYFTKETKQSDKLDCEENNIPSKNKTFEKLNGNYNNTGISNGQHSHLGNNSADSDKTDGLNNTDLKESTVKASQVHNETSILDSVPKFQKNAVDVFFETETGYCRKCRAYIEFDTDDIEKHIEEHIQSFHTAFPALYPTHIDKEKFTLKLDITHEINAVVTDRDDEPTINERNARDMSGYNSYDEEADFWTDKEFDPNEDTASINSSSLETRDGDIEVNNEACSSVDPGRFAKDNKISYNYKNSNAFCRICQVRLPSTLKSMQEHVKGLTHSKKVATPKVAMPKNTPSLRRQKMKVFVNTLRRSFHMFTPDDVTILINNNYALQELSFLLITRNMFGLRCLLCEEHIPYVVNLNLSLNIHMEGSHLQNMWNLPVITSVKSESAEFIREIRPGEFHCGRCNLVVTGWSEMEDHLVTFQHKSFKCSNPFD